MEGNRDRGTSSSSPRQNNSPFPFGSPLTVSDRSILSPGRQQGQAQASAASAGLNTSQTTVHQHVVRGKVRGQEVYGGPLIFGGNSSLRRNRLMSSTPYDISQRFHNRRHGNDAAATSKPKSSNAPTPSTSKSTTPTSDDGMSSTARLILDTLEKMSTPVRDAQKIPLVGRAEKRRQVMSELECSLVQAGPGTPSLKRRRPNLGAGSSTSLSETRTLLNGPPVRTLMSPVSTTPRPPRSAIKSARISTLTFNNATTTPNASAAPSPLQASQKASVANVSTLAAKPSTETAAPEKSKFQFPFSVPALSGGLANAANSQKCDEQKPPPVIFGSDFGKSGGKLRTKLGEKTVDLSGAEHRPEPLPAHLSNPAAGGLEVKQLPNFGFLQQKLTAPPSVSNTMTTTTLATTLKAPSDPSPLVNSLSTSSSQSSKSSTKTADTILLSPVKRFDSSSSTTSSATTTLTPSLTFRFSEPVSVTPNLASPMPPAATTTAAVNGDVKRFTFSQPVEVSPSGVAVAINQFAMPDLTSSVTSNSVSSLNAGGGIKPAQSLKTGSVMDILGGNHKLPDVTTSAGVNSSKVPMWSSSLKFGQNWSSSS